MLAGRSKSRSSAGSSSSRSEGEQLGVAHHPQVAALLSEKNLLLVNGKPYVRLALIGRGGSSKVFKVLSMDSKIYALKRIKLQLLITF